jgi:hypothetical protein
MKRDGPRVSDPIHDLLGAKYHPIEEANASAYYLGNQFTPHDLCDENHERWVEARVQALLESVDSNSPKRVRSCDVQKIVKTLKQREVCGIDGIPNECHRSFPRKLLGQSDSPPPVAETFS